MAADHLKMVAVLESVLGVADVGVLAAACSHECERTSEAVTEPQHGPLLVVVVVSALVVLAHVYLFKGLKFELNKLQRSFSKIQLDLTLMFYYY